MDKKTELRLVLLERFIFWINAVLFNLLFFKESKKKVSQVPKKY